MCNHSVIILPSPTPLLKESQVFYNIEDPHEKTNESTPAHPGFGTVMAPGSFTSEYSRVFANTMT